jgi:tetratricopeptide (TPR) repeat protein
MIARRDLGDALRAAGDLDDAAANLSQAIDLAREPEVDAGNARALDDLASTRIALAALAAGDARRLLQLSPDHPGAIYNLALARAATGQILSDHRDDVPGAIDAFREAEQTLAPLAAQDARYANLLNWIKQSLDRLEPDK